MDIRTAGTILAGIDSTPVFVSGSTTPRRHTYRGIGDLTLGAAYTLGIDDAVEVELSGRVKLPTARRSTGLSSGRTDASAGVQVARTFGRFAPFVAGTYRMLGDSDRLKLRDGFATSAGTSFTASDALVLLASYHYAARATRIVRDSHELFAGGSLLLPGQRLRLTGFATKGLSRGAADVSGGIGLAFGL